MYSNAILSDADETFKNWMLAFESAEKSSNDYQLAVVASNLGTFMLKRNNLSEAKQYLDLNSSINDSLNISELKMVNLRRLGGLYYKLKDPKLAEEKYLESIALANSKN